MRLDLGFGTSGEPHDAIDLLAEGYVAKELHLDPLRGLRHDAAAYPTCVEADALAVITSPSSLYPTFVGPSFSSDPRPILF